MLLTVLTNYVAMGCNSPLLQNGGFIKKFGKQFIGVDQKILILQGDQIIFRENRKLHKHSRKTTLSNLLYEFMGHKCNIDLIS